MHLLIPNLFYAFFLKNALGGRKNTPVCLVIPTHTFLHFLILQTEFFFWNAIHLRKLYCKRVTLLKKLFFLHVVLCQNIFVVAVKMLVRAIFVHALGFLQKELTILRSSKRSTHQSAVKRKRIYSKHCNWCFSTICVRDISWVTRALVFWLIDIFFIDCYIHDLTILPKVFISP